MKKLFLTVILAFVAVAAMAQSDRVVEKIVTYTTPFIPEHDFRLGIGVLPLTYGTVGNGIYYDSPMYPEGSDYYRTEEGFQTCAINLSYSYRAERWLEVGVLFSYNGIYDDVYLHRDGKQYLVGSNDVTDLSLIPMVRFSWYRSKYVRLYSAVGAGVIFSVSRYETDISRERNLEYAFAGQLTAFGVSAGRKLFGFAEVGSVGSAGVVSFGIGYRFADKNASVDRNIKY